MKEKTMSEEKTEEVEMLDEYDFSKVFPDSAAVNQALRQLIEQRSR